MENNGVNPLFAQVNKIKEVDHKEEVEQQAPEQHVSADRAKGELRSDAEDPFETKGECSYPTQLFTEIELPNIRSKDLRSKMDDINKMPATEITPELENMYAGTMLGQGCVSSGDVGSNFLDKAVLSNRIKVGDKDLGVNNLKLKATNNTNVNIARFKALINLGSPVQVTLYHSGFNITLIPPSNLAINSLDLKVTSAQLELGRKTMGLVSQFLGRDTTGLLTTNNKYFVINTIKPFILDHIADYTLNVPKEELFDHISMLDLNTILLGLIQAANGNRLSVKRVCTNLYNIEDNRPKCTATFDAVVDTSKLLFVDRSIFAEYKNMLGILGRKEPKSTSIEDVQEYLTSYKDYMNAKGYDKPYKTGSNNYLGVDLEIKFKIPTVSEYLRDSVLPLEKIATELETLTLSEDNKERKDTIEGLSESVYLTSLANSIEYIGTLDQNTGELIKLTKQEEIIELLESLSQDPNIIKNFEDNLIKFFGNSMLSIVATPRFTCPKCGHDQQEQVISNSVFGKDLIPLEVIHFFFYQTRVKLVRQRTQMEENNQ